MQIQIISRRVTLTRARVAAIRAQILKKLQRFAGSIGQVQMELADGNGRRGGGDKRCRIRVTLNQGPRIALDDVRADLGDAVRRAVTKLESAVHRRLRAAHAST